MSIDHWMVNCPALSYSQEWQVTCCIDNLLLCRSWALSRNTSMEIAECFTQRIQNAKTRICQGWTGTLLWWRAGKQSLKTDRHLIHCVIRSNDWRLRGITRSEIQSSVNLVSYWIDKKYYFSTETSYRNGSWNLINRRCHTNLQLLGKKKKKTKS